MGIKKIIPEHVVIAACLILVLSCSTAAHRFVGEENPRQKQYDLVLVHGLGNVHQWSDEFLGACLHYFGSGNVYVIYTNKSNRVYTRDISGKTVIVCGESTMFGAGRDFIHVQAKLIKEKIDILKQYGLGDRFNIIAHSMGGLTSRRFLYDNPGTVTALVTLGTPHKGSPLADSFEWAGLFTGAKDAISDLSPKRCTEFNKTWKVPGAPLVSGGRIYTIDGNMSGTGGFGALGELPAGWQVLKKLYGVDNDGMVPDGYARIEGAVHIKTFEGYDHYELVRKAGVAALACQYLR
jgi:pimeloyl-ACP methyl ester carboxylesterase